MALRRPHRKSRHGCLECKRRRVKCDEIRPTCSNCAKRHSECEYGSSTSLLWANEEPIVSRQSASRTSGSDNGQPSDSVLSSPSTDSLHVGMLSRLGGDGLSTPTAAAMSTSTPTTALNLPDLELMMHWCNDTYQTLSRNESTDRVWRNAVPEEALSHPFLMHGILALSALHLARTGPDPSRKTAFLNRAVTHQNQSLALFRELLSDIRESNAKAMFAFASVVVVYTFGFPHTPDAQDPGSCIEDLYQVLFLARGVQQVIRSPAEYLSHTNFAPILQIEEIQTELPDDANATINDLHEANEVCGAQNRAHETEVYTAAIDNVAEMLRWVYGGMTSNVVAGRWAIKLPSRFMELLREREPMALVLLAHFALLLHYLKHRWCFEDWCGRLAKAVWRLLDHEWRSLVHWAMVGILGENYLEKVKPL
ncbi:Sterol uptake control protein 2 [Penicillium ucsense]|uniref:Sterol uptake control protein 2 n=1 Tax=Penicillium ucsense TaxID=2839758 RepID=A0A8J8W2T0_9EURO|nr:Sterol uptake control protein 2 [Penicillium ucsense]KAF7734722.1 Sterol uptake control protein 2 [Penicillium ucsense]